MSHINEHTIAEWVEDAYLPLSRLGLRPLSRLENLQYHDTDDCQAYTGKVGDVAVIVYRGTDSNMDAIADAQFRMVPCSAQIADNWSWKPEGRVHRGFLRYFELTVKAICDDLQKLGCGRVVVCGHSLGGALATMMGCMLGDLGYDVTLVTFGSPRVGDATFIQRTETTVANIVRFVNYVDAVPRMPPALLGYRHTRGLAFFARNRNMFQHLPVSVRILDVVGGIAAACWSGLGIRWQKTIADHGMREYRRLTREYVFSRSINQLQPLVNLPTQ